MKVFFCALSAAVVSLACLNSVAAELPALDPAKRTVLVPDYLFGQSWLGWVPKFGFEFKKEEAPSIDKPNKVRSECFTKQQDALAKAFQNEKNRSYLQDPGIHKFEIEIIDNSKGILSKGDQKKHLKKKANFDAGKYSSTVMKVRAFIGKGGECNFLSAEELTSEMVAWLDHYWPLKEQIASFKGSIYNLNDALIAARGAKTQNHTAPELAKEQPRVETNGIEESEITGDDDAEGEVVL